MHHAPLRRQHGAVSFKFILIAFAVFFVLVIVLVLATAPSKKPATTSQSNGQNGGKPATGKQAQPGDQPAQTEAIIPLPDGFRRFTNKKYSLSFAYPEAWGGFTAVENTTSPRLRAETKEISYTYGTTPSAGQLTVSIYNKNEFQIAAKSTSPVLKPDNKDGKLGWKVQIPDPDDTKYRAGNAYPVASRKNPAEVTVFDFTWLLGGRRQARWLYETDSSYILVSVPPLVPTNGTSPREDDLVFYKTFAESIRDTITIPPSAETGTDADANSSETSR